MTKWVKHDEMSSCKKNRVMIYYAAPEGHKYGYFTSTCKNTRDQYVRERNND